MEYLSIAIRNHDPSSLYLALVIQEDVNAIINRKTVLTTPWPDEVLRILLDHRGIDINKPDSDGYTALHIYSLCERVSAVQMLLSAKADSSIENKYKALAIDLAIGSKNLPLVEILLDHGAAISRLSLRRAVTMARSMESLQSLALKATRYFRMVKNDLSIFIGTKVLVEVIAEYI